MNKLSLELIIAGINFRDWRFQKFHKDIFVNFEIYRFLGYSIGMINSISRQITANGQLLNGYKTLQNVTKHFDG